MMRQTGRTRPRTRGQSLTEAALLLPLFLLLLLGIEELGRAAYAGIETADAAYAGALYGAQSNTTAVDDNGMVQAALNDGRDLASLGATATHVCECASGGSAPDCTLGDCVSSRLVVYTEVNTTSTFTPMCTFPGIPAGFTIHGHAYLRAAQ